MAFVFNNTHLNTFGDIMNMASEIYERGDKAEGQAFMEAYRATNPEGADANVGYLTGYMDPETMAGMQSFFGVSHPIFGTRTDVTPDEAFKKGMEIGEQMKKRET